MSNNLKYMILEKVARSVKSVDSVQQHTIFSNICLKTNKTNGAYSFTLPLKSKNYNIQNDAQNIVQTDSKDIFHTVGIDNKKLFFDISRDAYIKTVLESNCISVPPPFIDEDKKIIVEFSSPNIAKPFHLGNFRSTIIGNYIANINSFLGHNVKRINYLGDWGTQFGFIQVGMQMSNVGEEEMKANPIKTLYNAYVSANKLAVTDPLITEQARSVFAKLETGDDVIYQNWETFKSYTVEELKKTYERIGVVFDEYHWESMYNVDHIRDVITLMEKMQLLELDKEKRKVVSLNANRTVPILKSDGSTLYITRDIAAAIDRFEKNMFDAMYYVVDNAQSDHFSCLMQVLNKMEMPWADRLQHIKFGRIRGLSTRKGTAVFLEDILNEARDLMKEKQKTTATTKVSLDSTDNSAEVLGMSAVIIQDLKQRRQKDYEFDWNTVLNMKGDTGIKLQYTHCRLANLECTSGATLIPECDPSLLKEPEVDDLVALIGKFDEVILRSYENLEPCILTVYLFQLSNSVNKGLKTLRIKGEPSDLGNQRLLLFHTARKIMAQGLTLLGLTPLDKM